MKIVLLSFMLILSACANLPGTLGHKFREDTIEKYIAEHPDRAKYAEAIRAEKVMIGMNEEEAYLSWGEPTVKNRSVSANGVRVQWVYRQQYKNNYIYFENGVLSHIQS